MNRTLRSVGCALRALTAATQPVLCCKYGYQAAAVTRLTAASTVMVQERGMAGHSKWQNIRHTKGANDIKKGRAAVTMNRKIKIAIKEGGSSDPKLNHLLARAVDEANRLDIPKTTIMNAIKQCEMQKKDGKPVTMECRGPGNCMLIVECETANAKVTRQNLTTVLKRVGGSVLDKGIAAHCFDQKGMLTVQLPSDSDICHDKAEEIAIEVEAEEVSVIEENGNKSLQFICSMEDTRAVKQNLSDKGYSPITNLTYIPTMFTTLNEQEQKLAEVMFDKFDEIEEVIKIHDNIEVATS